MGGLVTVDNGIVFPVRARDACGDGLFASLVFLKSGVLLVGSVTQKCYRLGHLDDSKT